MNNLSVETEDSFASLHELAANNEVEGLKKCIERDASCAEEIAPWYGRQRGSNQMVIEDRTPLMVAATYGSIDVIKFILSATEADVNRTCGVDKTTALHCALAGGSPNSIEVAKLLLAAGADPSAETPNSVETIKPNAKSPIARREYPIDPTIPDIKNSVYSTDEFRMYSFKVRPCSRAYSHDWTECPFVHPGENARRRDPRKFHYSCVPCPEFRKGACRRGDMCEYAHGVFECWLHPAQYRTRLCKDGVACARRVCFFAHTSDELRPLYVSGASPVSPRFDVLGELGRLSVDDSMSPTRAVYSPTRVVSPVGARVGKQAFRSLSSRELGSRIWTRWGSANGRADWSVSAGELEKLRTTSSYEEPDLSWVQSLVKESPADFGDEPSGSKAGPGPSVIGQLKIDQLVAR